MANDIKHIEIGKLNLQSSKIGQDINERFDAIDKNFEQIIQSEYLKGVKGDSVYTENVVLTNDSNTLTNTIGYQIFEKIKSLIFSNFPAGYEATETERINKLKDSVITLIYEKTEVEEPVLLSMTPFIYKDPKFDSNIKNFNIEDGNDNTDNINKDNSISNLDLSCTIYYERPDDVNTTTFLDGFTKLSTTPTVYFDEDKKRFSWKINGVETGLEAQGPPGVQGKQGFGLIVAKYKIENGVCEITHVADYDKDTKANSVTEGPSNLWTAISDLQDKSLLVNNSLVFALRNSESTEDTEDDDRVNIEDVLPIVEEVETETKPDLYEDWIWGLLVIDKTAEGVKYKIKSGGSLGWLLGLDGKSLLELMQQNRYTYIPIPENDNHDPNKFPTPQNGAPQNGGHIIYADTQGGLHIAYAQLNDGQISTSDKEFISHYGNHKFNKIEIPTEYGSIVLGKTNKEGKTYYADFSTAGTIKGTIKSSEQLVDQSSQNPYSVGDSENPIYFSNGVPAKCGKNLAVNITGKAATAGTAEQAQKLTVNAGSATKPVYFKDGVPMECPSITTDAKDAEQAQKLVDNKKQVITTGATNQPVYFKDGVPVACGKTLDVGITGKAATAGIADYALQLQSKQRSALGVGNETTPVYFSNGVPVACKTISIKANEAGTADQAKKLTVSAGSESKPVYFKDGVPTVCTKMNSKPDEAGTADQAKKLTTTNVGSTSEPVYFSNGVPVKCGKIQSATSADKLATSIKFKTSGGVISAAQSFNGESDVTLPITSINESFLNWNTKHETRGPVQLTPIDVALNTELNANRLSFMPARDIEIEYSQDGGETWNDYELSDESKRSHVTTGLGCDLYLGKKESKQTPKDMLRVTITAREGITYFSLKKILIQLSTNGAIGTSVKVETRKIMAIPFKEYGSYPLSGWSGWCSIPIVSPFGGAKSQTSNIREIRLTYSMTGNNDNTSCRIMALAMHGENSWSNSGNALASLGHLFGWDINQNAFFPAGLSVETKLDASSITSKDNQLRNINALNILPMSGYGKIGDSNNIWEEIYANKLNVKNFAVSSITATTANFTDATISKADIDEIKQVKIQDKLPSSSSITLEAKKLNYTITNNITAMKTYGVDPGGGRNSGTIHISNIVLKTSELPMVMNDAIDIKIDNICFPIGITYINDYDDVKKYSNWWWRTFRYWAYVGITAVKVSIYNGNTLLITKDLSGYTTTLYDEYSSNKRNGAIYYPSTNFTFDDFKLTKSGSKYKDITLTVKISYEIYRTVGRDYEDATRTRVDYVYTPGAFITKSNPSAWQAKHVYTGYPAISSQNKAKNDGVVNGIYTAQVPTSNYIYLTNEGIQIMNGRSALTIVPPKDGNGKGKGDDFGYIEVKQFRTDTNNVTYNIKKKSFWDLLS